MSKYILTVTKVEELTADSKAIYFEDDANSDLALAGQFLTIITSINDKELRRSYSIFTPASKGLAIGIKRVAGGIVSNYLNTYLKKGSKVEVQGPSGKFVYKPEQSLAQHILLIAGGSGITPMMSILETALSKAPHTQISMLFVNKSRNDIMFKQALDVLASDHSERFDLIHYIDSENEQKITLKKSGVSGLFGGKIFQVIPGFINKEKAESLFTDLKVNDNTKAFVCGPSGLMNLVEESLLTFGLAQGNIKKENFIPSTEVRVAPDFEPIACDANICIGGQSYSFNIPSGKSVLQAAVEANIDMPFSCREGTCTSCYGKCKSGEVGALTDEALTDEEIAEGGFLPCVSFPKSKKITIDMD